MLPETLGLLYVGGLQAPFATMTKMRREVRELHNRIIECNWDAEKNEWAFMRERTDKSYPNGFATAQGNIISKIKIQMNYFPFVKLLYYQYFSTRRGCEEHTGARDDRDAARVYCQEPVPPPPAPNRPPPPAESRQGSIISKEAAYNTHSHAHYYFLLRSVYGAEYFRLHRALQKCCKEEGRSSSSSPLLLIYSARAAISKEREMTIRMKY